MRRNTSNVSPIGERARTLEPVPATSAPANGRVYLDHAATTPMLPEAVDVMLPLLSEHFGNPSGVHAHARQARAVLEESRDRLADVLGCRAREVVFTGGGTEALNFALRGIGGAARDPLTIALSTIEHDAVRNTTAAMVHSAGTRAVELPVSGEGVLDLGAAEARIDSSMGIVAVMAVNNEVGTIQPIEQLAAIVRANAPDAVLVVDAVQAMAWIDVRPLARFADLLALSAHKFGGPKGTGCLVVREGVVIEPLIHGGGQERDRRSGTQNVAGIAAMAEAAVITDARRSATVLRVGRLRDRLLAGLCSAIPRAAVTTLAARAAGSAHVCIDGIESEELLILLDRDGVSASAGSACASGALHVSPVLLAMGVPKERALGSLRLTLGASTTDADVDLVLEVLPRAVARLLA